MEQELSYSFHLGSDKNKSKLTKIFSKENYEKFNTKLKEIKEKCRTTLINLGLSKYFNINFAIAKLMEI